jgi:hypothetical protein
MPRFVLSSCAVFVVLMLLSPQRALASGGVVDANVFLRHDAEELWLQLTGIDAHINAKVQSSAGRSSGGAVETRVTGMHARARQGGVDLEVKISAEWNTGMQVLWGFMTLGISQAFHRSTNCVARPSVDVWAADGTVHFHVRDAAFDCSGPKPLLSLAIEKLGGDQLRDQVADGVREALGGSLSVRDVVARNMNAIVAAAADRQEQRAG